MNTYYQKSERSNSNNDVFEKYFWGEVRHVSTWKKATDRILALISAFLLLLTSARVRTVARVSFAALSLVGFIGVIGAMESGSLRLDVGLLIGACLLGVEIVCLRHH